MVVMLLGLSGMFDASQRLHLFVAGAGIIVYAWLLSLAFLVGCKPTLRWIIAVLNAVGLIALFVLLSINLRPFLYLLWIATIRLSCIIIRRWQVIKR